MSVAKPLGRHRKQTAYRSLAVVAVAVLCVVWTLVSTWHSAASLGQTVGTGVVRALWLLPALVALHLSQLLLAGAAWRCLFTPAGANAAAAAPVPPIRTFYALRIIREGIDSLLPVLQIGGEFVGAQLLSRRGVVADRAGASVIVDVTMELLTQVLFLFAGLAALAHVSRFDARGVWSEAVMLAAAVAGGFLLAQRFGLLAALESLMRRIAGRWPLLAGASLAGLNDAALRFYRQPGSMLRSVVLHLIAWFMGTAETWLVLHALDVQATPLQALTVESLGMAARSAGFAIPGALGIQEGGFVLASMAIGLPAAPALSLSLIKRIREISVGLIGVGLWRWQVRGRAKAAIHALDPAEADVA